MRSVNFAGQSITPSKILCVGRNYVAHISELGNEVPDDMVIFIKPNSAIG
ncbi:MAG: FAA hydrolase family protein, partial [Pseudomonadota bacterium]